MQDFDKKYFLEVIEMQGDLISDQTKCILSLLEHLNMMMQLHHEVLNSDDLMQRAKELKKRQDNFKKKNILKIVKD